MNARLLVMTKAPIPGTVKTRLRLDPDAAARLQAVLILDTVEKARALGPTIVAGAPRDRLDPISRLLPPDVRLIPQPGGDLGERMLAAATTLFDESPEPVLILDTDAPTLPPQAILRSAQALTTHHLSIIPGTDGGYVLLGLRGAYEAVFSGIEWSTEGVHSQTLARAAGAGLSVCEGGGMVRRRRAGGSGAPQGGARGVLRTRSPHRGGVEGPLSLRSGRGPGTVLSWVA